MNKSIKRIVIVAFVFFAIGAPYLIYKKITNYRFSSDADFDVVSTSYKESSYIDYYKSGYLSGSLDLHRKNIGQTEWGDYNYNKDKSIYYNLISTSKNKIYGQKPFCEECQSMQ